MAYCAMPSTRNFGHLLNHRATEFETTEYEQCFFWKFDDLQIGQDISGEAIVAFRRDPDEQNYHPDDSGRLVVFEVMQVLLDVEGMEERQAPMGFVNVLAVNEAVRTIFAKNTSRIAKLLGDTQWFHTMGEAGVARLSRLCADSIAEQERLADEATLAVMSGCEE